MGYMTVPHPRNSDRQRELREIKDIYGVSGFAFFKRPCFNPRDISEMLYQWECSKIDRWDNCSVIEITNTHPKDLKKLLDGLLNLEDNPNPPEVSFRGRKYSNLEDLWKAMGKI